jgi:hypothetical protein
MRVCYKHERRAAADAGLQNKMQGFTHHKRCLCARKRGLMIQALKLRQSEAKQYVCSTLLSLQHEPACGYAALTHAQFADIRLAQHDESSSSVTAH